MASAPPTDLLSVHDRAEVIQQREKSCKDFLTALRNLVKDPAIKPRPDSFDRVEEKLKENAGKTIVQQMSIIKQLGKDNRGLFGSAKELVGKRSEDSSTLYKTLENTTIENANISMRDIKQLHRKLNSNFEHSTANTPSLHTPTGG